LLLMFQYLYDHFVNLPFSSHCHPIGVSRPFRFAFAEADYRRSISITHRMNEVEDGRIVVEMRLMNRPIASQAIVHESIASGFSKASTFRFASHLFSELLRAFHTRNQRPMNSFGLVWWIAFFSLRRLGGLFLIRQSVIFASLFLLLAVSVSVAT
jgi:hypothetical protein